MSNATQILLWTKSNLEIVDLNFVTPKRFGSLRPASPGRSACRYIREVRLVESQSQTDNPLDNTSSCFTHSSVTTNSKRDRERRISTSLREAVDLLTQTSRPPHSPLAAHPPQTSHSPLTTSSVLTSADCPLRRSQSRKSPSCRWT